MQYLNGSDLGIRFQSVGVEIQPIRQLVKARDVAKKLGVSVSWVIQHASGKRKPYLPAVKMGPGNRLSECVDILAVHFREKAIYRLSAPESIRYNQIVLFGVRRTRREREQLKDWDVQRAKAKLMGFARNCDELPALPDQADSAIRCST